MIRIHIRPFLSIIILIVPDFNNILGIFDCLLKLSLNSSCHAVLITFEQSAAGHYRYITIILEKQYLLLFRVAFGDQIVAGFCHGDRFRPAKIIKNP